MSDDDAALWAPPGSDKDAKAAALALARAELQSRRTTLCAHGVTPGRCADHRETAPKETT